MESHCGKVVTTQRASGERQGLEEAGVLAIAEAHRQALVAQLADDLGVEVDAEHLDAGLAQLAHQARAVAAEAEHHDVGLARRPALALDRELAEGPLALEHAEHAARGARRAAASTGSCRWTS